MNVTNTLIANITATEDTTQNVIVNRTVPNLIFDSTTATGILYQALANGANVITLPAATCYQLYVRNADPTTSIRILPTLVTGGAQTVAFLLPGDAFFLWQKPAGVGAGFTALTLQTTAAGVLAEYFIGA